MCAVILFFCLALVQAKLYHISPPNTPQQAYHAAVQENDPAGSVIMLMPGVYPYGVEQFDISVPNIVFKAASSSPNMVIFTAESENGGIHINYPINSFNNYVSFEGITFGLPGSSVGFLINVTGGQAVLYHCSVSDSNFRVYVGGSGFSIFGAVESTFNALPPNSLITTVASDTVVFLKDNVVTQLGNGAPVEPGGYLVDMSQGIGECRMVSNHFVFSAYNAVLKTPLSEVTGESQITSDGDIIIVNDGGHSSYIEQGGGSYNCVIQGGHMSLQSGLLRQNENSDSEEYHRVIVQASLLSSREPLYAYSEAVEIIGQNEFSLINSAVSIENSNLFVNITRSSGGDKLTLTLSGLHLKTQGDSGSVCAKGPSSAVAKVAVGYSNVISGGNMFEGFLYTAMTPL